MTEKIILTWGDFERGIKRLAKYIELHKSEISNIYGIPRGGMIIAVRLSHLLDLPYVDRIKRQYINNATLIVDDVADTGKTLVEYKKYKIATLHYKPWSIIKPGFYVWETDKWIVYPWERIKND